MTVTDAPAPQRPPLRLLPAPSADPPYDDEVAAAVPVVTGSLALAFPAPVTSLPLRLVPPAVAPPTPTGRTAAALPDARLWTARLAQALVEVLAGSRPAAQLACYATLDVLAHLERAAGRLATRPGPVTAARTHRTAPVRRPVLSSLRVTEPVPGVAEVCAVVDTGPRRRAVALRLEGRGGRWQCTDLQIG